VTGVFCAILTCKSLATVSDIVVDDEQISIVVIGDVLEKTFGVNVGGGKQSEIG